MTRNLIPFFSLILQTLFPLCHFKRSEKSPLFNLSFLIIFPCHFAGMFLTQEKNMTRNLIPFFSLILQTLFPLCHFKGSEKSLTTNFPILLLYLAFTPSVLLRKSKYCSTNLRIPSSIGVLGLKSI